MFSYLFGTSTQEKKNPYVSLILNKSQPQLQLQEIDNRYPSDSAILGMATKFVRIAKEAKKQHATQDYVVLEVIDSDRVLLTINSLKRLSYRGELRFEGRLAQYLRKVEKVNQPGYFNFGIHEGGTVGGIVGGVDDYEIIQIMPRSEAYALLYCIVKSIEPREVEIYWDNRKKWTYINFT